MKPDCVLSESTRRFLGESYTGYSIQYLRWEEASSILGLAHFPEIETNDVEALLREYDVQSIMEKKLMDSAINNKDDSFIIQYCPRKRARDKKDITITYDATAWRKIIAALHVAAESNILLSIIVKYS